jgi:hypothetical protein
LILSRGRDFSLHHCVQTSSGINPVSYPVGTGTLSPGVKLLGHKADHSLPSNAEVNNVELYLHSLIQLYGVMINEACGQLDLFIFTFMLKQGSSLYSKATYMQVSVKLFLS